VWCPQFEFRETQLRRGIPGQNSNRRHHAFPTGDGERASRCPADQSIQQTCGISGFEMARPGLEPGTPRFSVLGPTLSNWTEIPDKQRVLAQDARQRNSSLFAIFCAAVGYRDRFRYPMGGRAVWTLSTRPVGSRSERVSGQPGSEARRHERDALAADELTSGPGVRASQVARRARALPQAQGEHRPSR
jgi:hypothetical protein